MKSQKIPLGQYPTQQLAEDAIRELKKKGYDIKKMSIIGKDCYTEQKVLGNSNAYDRIEKWSTVELLSIALTGYLFGFFFFFNLSASMPYLKLPIIYACAVLLTAACIALLGLGLPKSGAIKYKTRIQARKFILCTDESAGQVNSMRALLHASIAKKNSITGKVHHNLLQNDSLKKNQKRNEYKNRSYKIIN